MRSRYNKYRLFFFYETCYLSTNGHLCIIECTDLVHPTLQCARDDLLRGTAKIVMMSEESEYCVGLTLCIRSLPSRNTHRDQRN